MNAPDDHSDPRPPPRLSYRVLTRAEGPLLNLVGMTCRDFASLTVTRMDRPLTTRETIRLRFHGIACSICRRFAAQFETLNELLRETAAEPPPEELAPPPEDDAPARIAAAVRAAAKE
jgi:hypothetical protein